MKIKRVLLSFIVVLFFKVANAQSEHNRWVMGASIGGVFYPKNMERQNIDSNKFQMPIFTLAGYVNKLITIESSIGFSAFTTQEYLTFDGALRYTFLKETEQIAPYLLLGGSFIAAKAITPTLNFGAGSTFWVSSNYGINLQITYKYSKNSFESQGSHFYPSVGVVYSFKPRGKYARWCN